MSTMKLRGKINFPATVTATGGLQVVKANGIWTVSPNFAGLTSIAASAVSDPTTQQVWIYNPAANSYAVLTLAALGDALFKLTSTTSTLIGTGSKVFATQTGKDVAAGQYVSITSDAAPSTNFMIGQITAYASGSLTVNVTTIGGSGTFTDWTIRVGGAPGVTGATGATGAGYGGTSATSLLIANSVTKIFTTQAGLAYQVGNYVRASSAANGANYMEGLVSAYTGTSLSIAVTKIGGSGTFADWVFAVSGTPGAGDLISTNNLSDVTAKYTAKDNLTVHGADIASAATVNLETATGDLVDVTGVVTITAITLNDGHERTVRFTGILTLTNGASLVLPGGVSITTAAGDYAVFRGYAAGVVRCVEYTRASGKPVVANTAAEVGAQAADAQLFSNIPQNSQSVAYGLVATDAQKHIFHPSADTTARTFTIPANASVAYAIGTTITFVNQNAAGIVTIAITTDTMRLAGAGTTGNRTLAANGIATALKVTATEWLVSGTGLT